MKKKPIYLFLLFIFSACVNSDQQKIPEWVSNPPKMEGKMYAVGISDNGKLLSLVDALGALSLSIDSHVSGSETVETAGVATKFYKTIVSEYFGDIKISYMNLSDSTRSTRADTILKTHNSYVYKMVYSKQNSSMIIRTFNEETYKDNNIQNKGTYEIVYNNADYSDIAKELKSVGVVIKTTFQDNIHYYTLLEFTKSLQYEKQKELKEKQSIEESEELFKELEKYLGIVK